MFSSYLPEGEDSMIVKDSLDLVIKPKVIQGSKTTKEPAEIDLSNGEK